MKIEGEIISRNFTDRKIEGVYLLLDKSQEKVLYIGASIDIKSRIKQHYAIPWEYYSIIEENDSEARANLEIEKIHKYNPPFNRLKTRRSSSKCSGNIVAFNPDKPITPLNLNGTIFVQKPPTSRSEIKRRVERWKMEARLKETYKERFETFSSRQIQGLLQHHFGLKVNHNTVNCDRKMEKYTPYLNFKPN